ncbi:MAG: tetratricopeptide repeat protein [Hyphomicrobiaceae bacterium]
MRFVSPEAALQQGLGAYRSGVYPLAEQALGYAADRGSILGKYYLSRLYADSNSPRINHARAYELVYDIVKQHAARIDVDDDPRARYVGKSLTAMALYWLRGLPEIGIQRNAERAAGYLQEAATFFRDHDAQFELAKLYLTGEGVPLDRRQGLHWLSRLSQAGHAGAQAFLAQLYWNGKLVPKDEAKALALITLASENAPNHERIWIEDIYQSIFCGMSAGVRRNTQGLIGSFRKHYSPAPGAEPLEALGLAPSAQRTCADGTPLPSRSGDAAGVESQGNGVARSRTSTDGQRIPSFQSGVLGIGERR